ncbi:hypothetical protein M0R45_008979 [Rubus argutus]|uniref:Uncharacterized protein n=1 Tax=Rubus argutus TaxID=59490 RepID=A0AAW1Y383_RUBAR
MVAFLHRAQPTQPVPNSNTKNQTKITFNHHHLNNNHKPAISSTIPIQQLTITVVPLPPHGLTKKPLSVSASPDLHRLRRPLLSPMPTIIIDKITAGDPRSQLHFNSD